jgi:hypothetical protein
MTFAVSDREGLLLPRYHVYQSNLQNHAGDHFMTRHVSVAADGEQYWTSGRGVFPRGGVVNTVHPG